MYSEKCLIFTFVSLLKHLFFQIFLYKKYRSVFSKTNSLLAVNVITLKNFLQISYKLSFKLLAQMYSLLE